MDEYYVLVRLKVKADNPDAAHQQVRNWIVRLDKAIKGKLIHLPPGVNRVFEMSDDVRKVVA